MATRSRAVVLPEIGESLELREFDVPDPGDMAAIVNVEYGGICGTDLHLMKGRLPIPTPLVLGHEATGRIHRLGPGLEKDVLGQPLSEGDAVTWQNSIPCGRCFYCLVEEEPTLCTGSRRVYGINQGADDWPHLSGGWSDYMYLHPGTVIVKLPEGVRTQDVVALGCAGPTAVHGVLDEVQVRFGDTVAVQGSGPVGIAAAIYAQLAGAGKVILVGGPAGRLDQAADLGIGQVHIDVFETPDPAERLELVQDETPRGEGADVVIECTGVPDAVAEGIDLCRPNAQYCVLGQYTDRGDSSFNPHQITRKQLHVHGSWGFSARHYIGYVQSLPRLLQDFDLAGLVSSYPLEEANTAVEDVANGRVMKAALHVGASASESHAHG
ncbi:MAG: zinc-binding dehydrogenase [Pseudonocardiaceae bacterium]